MLFFFKNDETVIFICGDHGMKDSGSHGGASHSEITVPLVLIQNKGCVTAYVQKFRFIYMIYCILN